MTASRAALNSPEGPWPRDPCRPRDGDHNLHRNDQNLQSLRVQSSRDRPEILVDPIGANDKYGDGQSDKHNDAEYHEDDQRHRAF